MPLPWATSMEKELEEIYGTKWKGKLPFLWAECAEKTYSYDVRVNYMNVVTNRFKKPFFQKNLQNGVRHTMLNTSDI